MRSGGGASGPHARSGGAGNVRQRKRGRVGWSTSVDCRRAAQASGRSGASTTEARLAIHFFRGQVQFFALLSLMKRQKVSLQVGEKRRRFSSKLKAGQVYWAPWPVPSCSSKVLPIGPDSMYASTWPVGFTRVLLGHCRRTLGLGRAINWDHFSLIPNWAH